MRQIAIFLLAGLLTLLVSLPLAAKILLHADYARSEPAADAVLATPPTQVKVWFTQELFRREGENWLRVTAPDGSRVEVGDAVVDDNDRHLLTVALAEGLGEGSYRVEWRALSADDGHPKESEFSFSVGAPSSPPAATAVPDPTATAPSPAQPAASSESGGLPCLGAAPLALLVVGGLLVRRRKR